MRWFFFEKKVLDVIVWLTISCLQIKTPAQLEAAFSFFASTGSENFEVDEFEEACGVGMMKWALILTHYV